MSRVLRTRQNGAALRGWPSHVARRLPVHCGPLGSSLFGHLTRTHARMATIASHSAQKTIGGYGVCVYLRPLPASTPLHGHCALAIFLKIITGHVGNCHRFTPR